MPKRLPEDPRLTELLALYEQARRRLERTVRAALERGAEGTAAYYARQLAIVERLLSDLQDAAVPLGTEAIGEAYQRSALAVDAALAPAVGFRFAGVHRGQAEVLADNLVNRLNEAAVHVGRRTDDAFRKASLREVALGVIEGRARREVSAALERRIIDEGLTDALTGFVDAAGRRWGLDAYAAMVARTTTREAATAATVARLEELDEDLVTISRHLNSCEICIPFQGKTYSISGRSRRYPPLDRRPPFHPNCRHVATPAAGNLKAFERELGVGATG